MTREHLQDLLENWGAVLRTGMIPSAFPSENALAKMQSAGGHGVGGHRIPAQFINVMPSQLAALNRAIIERLDPVEIDTVITLYGTDLHTRQQQAAHLGIRPPALKVRRRKIHIKLLDWFSPGGKHLRRLAQPWAAK